MGNVNKAYAEFSNNPNDEQGGKGKTEWDTVIVFTYETIVNKVDKDNLPLEGATFSLEKFVANAEGTETFNKIVGNWVAIDTVETKPSTTFTFKGLDDGEYRLKEVKAPEGYNAIDDVYFTVVAEHQIEWATQARTDILTSLTGNVTTGELKFTADKDAGKFSTDVVNEKGLILPETGGIGTTIFYIVGILLVVGAAIVLITKKRMGYAK